MSDFIDTREGWREIDRDEPLSLPYIVAIHDEGKTRYWVREAPVPPLPTEPGYYVDQDGCAWRLGDDGEWDDTFGNPIDLKHRDSQPKRLLVRYEPRAVTAKTVLDRVLNGNGILSTRLDAIAREFGVTS